MPTVRELSASVPWIQVEAAWRRLYPGCSRIMESIEALYRSLPEAQGGGRQLRSIRFWGTNDIEGIRPDSSVTFALSGESRQTVVDANVEFAAPEGKASFLAALLYEMSYYGLPRDIPVPAELGPPGSNLVEF